MAAGSIRERSRSLRRPVTLRSRAAVQARPCVGGLEIFKRADCVATVGRGGHRGGGEKPHYQDYGRRSRSRTPQSRNGRGGGKGGDKPQHHDQELRQGIRDRGRGFRISDFRCLFVFFLAQIFSKTGCRAAF